MVRDANEVTPKLGWSELSSHSREKLASMRDVVRRLGLAHVAVDGLPASFAAICRTSWSNSWQESLISTAGETIGVLDDFESAIAGVSKAVNLPMMAGCAGTARSLLDLVALSLRTYFQDFRFAFAPDCPATIEAAEQALGLLETYGVLESELSVRFAPEAVRRIALDTLDARIAAADRGAQRQVAIARKWQKSALFGNL